MGFPLNPSEGTQYVSPGGVKYTYVSATRAWNKEQGAAAIPIEYNITVAQDTIELINEYHLNSPFSDATISSLVIANDNDEYIYMNDSGLASSSTVTENLFDNFSDSTISSTVISSDADEILYMNDNAMETSILLDLEPFNDFSNSLTSSMLLFDSDFSSAREEVSTYAIDFSVFDEFNAPLVTTHTITL